MSELPRINRRRFDGLSLTVIDTGVTEWRASYTAPRSEWVKEAASIDPEGMCAASHECAWMGTCSWTTRPHARWVAE